MNEELKLLVIPVLIGVLEVFKKLGIEVRYIPVISVVLGLVTGLALNGMSVESVLTGIMYGLSACGLYSGTKTTLDK